MSCEEIVSKLREIPITCEEDLDQIEDLLDSLCVTYVSELNCAYQTPGCDLYYYAYAFVHDGEIGLFTGSYSID